jgi:hypothetical protein
MRLRKSPSIFLVLNKRFSKRKQEVSTRLGSAQGCAVRAGALKSGWAAQDQKNGRAAFLLLTFLWPFKEHDSLELRNSVSVSHHLVAVKGETPTIKVKSGASSEGLPRTKLITSSLIYISILQNKQPSLKAQFQKHTNSQLK